VGRTRETWIGLALGFRGGEGEQLLPIKRVKPSRKRVLNGTRGDASGVWSTRASRGDAKWRLNLARRAAKWPGAPRRRPSGSPVEMLAQECLSPSSSKAGCERPPLNVERGHQRLDRQKRGGHRKIRNPSRPARIRRQGRNVLQKRTLKKRQKPTLISHSAVLEKAQAVTKSTAFQVRTRRKTGTAAARSSTEESNRKKKT